MSPSEDGKRPTGRDAIHRKHWAFALTSLAADPSRRGKPPSAVRKEAANRRTQCQFWQETCSKKAAPLFALEAAIQYPKWSWPLQRGATMKLDDWQACLNIPSYKRRTPSRSPGRPKKQKNTDDKIPNSFSGASPPKSTWEADLTGCRAIRGHRARQINEMKRSELKPKRIDTRPEYVMAPCLGHFDRSCLMTPVKDQ